jgi:hypothetical protein
MATKKPAITEVKDFNGTPVHVGDKVVYIAKTYCTSELAFGTVTGLSKVFGKKCVVIEDDLGSKSKPTSQSIYKVD